MVLPDGLLHQIETDVAWTSKMAEQVIPNMYEPLTPEMKNGMAKRLHNIDDIGLSGRRLVVGCDGTWVNSDDDASIPSNVTRLCRALRTSSRPSSSSSSSENSLSTKKDQLIYYHRGIGTNGEMASKWIGGGTGNELSEHTRECYGFLCNNWREGDEIFLFGFSRGAYTARTVSALISDLGLLTSIGMEWFYEIFEDWKNQNIPSKHASGKVEYGVFKGLAQRPRISSDEYRNELERRGYTIPDVPVKVVGVWDTVGSLGIPPILGLNLAEEEHMQYSWVNTKVSQCVVHAFQALGLDEHRASYSPAVWEIPEQPNNLMTLKQCWFPGVHCSTGGAGGYQDQGLANIALAWMVSQLQSITNSDGTKGVLDFDEEYLKWVFTQNMRHVQEVYPEEGFRGWSLGKIKETMTTTYSLIGQHKAWSTSKNVRDWLLVGDVPRTPGRFEEIETSDGKPVKTGRMLRTTHEKIHSSARIRVSNGGRGVIDAGVESSTYTPRGLEGWTIIGDGNHNDPLADGFAWVSEDGKVVLQEDTLGEFEKQLLALSQAVATQKSSNT